MDESLLHRPLLSARTRRTVISAGIVAAALFGTGMLAGALLHRAPSVERITVQAAPVKVEVPTAAAPIVSLNVPEAPPPVSAVPAPPSPSVSPSPRPLVPKLWPECVTAMMATDVTAVCNWDDGFPAISADGSLIAIKSIPDDSGRGNPGLSINFLDASTGKLVRCSLILSPDEYIADDGSGAKENQRQQANIATRTAAVQKTLDEGHYRTMAALGDWERSVEGDAHAASDHRGTYADITETGAVRIVDPTTNTVLWQYSFATGGASKQFLDGEGMCGGWGMRRMGVWWDPTERVVVASTDYQTGGCMCSDETIDQVVRM